MEIAYFKIPGFELWYKNHSYTQITEENAHYYYILFQQEQRCRTKACQTCTGEFITFHNEIDITKGVLTPKRCTYLEIEKRRKASEELRKKIVPPPRYAANTWDSIAISDANRQILKQYIDAFPNVAPPSLYLYATSHSVPKSATMWLIVTELLKASRLCYSVVIESTSLLLSKIKEGEFTSDGINYAFKQALNCELLVLDDFGIEKQTVWSGEKMYTLISERSAKNRPIIIVSHMEPDPLLWQSPFENSVIGKILESSTCVNLEAK